jgi:hypothetical protein
MKNDEGIFKMLSKSSIIGNQYENVIPINPNENSKRAVLTALFFMFKFKKIS